MQTRQPVTQLSDVLLDAVLHDLGAMPHLTEVPVHAPYHRLTAVAHLFRDRVHADWRALVERLESRRTVGVAENLRGECRPASSRLARRRNPLGRAESHQTGAVLAAPAAYFQPPINFVTRTPHCACVDPRSFRASKANLHDSDGHAVCHQNASPVSIAQCRCASCLVRGPLLAPDGGRFDMRTACEDVAVATLLGLMVAGCRGEGTAPSTAAPVKVNAEALDVADGRGFPYRDVSAGYDHTCGVTRVGAAYCWGDFSFGALGIGPPPLSTTRPLAVVGGHRFASLSAGALRTCGVTLSGEAYCWGRSDGTTANSERPVAVAGGLSFATVSTGSNHRCGVTRSGEAYWSGDNRSGQLGDGTTASSATPVAVAGGLKFGTVSVGGGHTCGVTRSGEAYCWGDNGSGQLGDGGSASGENPAAAAGGLSQSAVGTEGGRRG